MNENLKDMIEKNDKTESKIPSETDISDNKDTVVEEEVKPIETSRFAISTIMFPEWFNANHMNFENIGHVKASIKNVDKRQDLILKIPDPNGVTLEDGSVRQRLRVMEDADKIPVLDLPGIDMSIYKNNTFQIVYDLGDGKFLKSYGIKTGLINIFCISMMNGLIPYAKMRMKRKEEGIDIIEPNLKSIETKLAKPVDLESIQIQYKQITKHIDKVSDAPSVVKWFRERSASIYDVNHLLLIDDVLMSLVV